MASPKQIYGLIGYPVKHSLSASMHNAAFRSRGIDAEYRLFEVEPGDLEDFLLNPDKEVCDIEANYVRGGDIAGFNITIPHKVRAKQILERAFPPKSLSGERDYHCMVISGAINTVKREREYTNTDVHGFLKSLEKDLQFKTEYKTALVVGCGGAGRAVVAGLSWAGANIKKIYIYEKNNKVAHLAQGHFSSFPELSGKWEFISHKHLPEIVKKCDLLVNASPVGMKEGGPTIIDKELLHKGLFVYDLVYNRETELVKDAKFLGLPAYGGRGMLLYQGAASWQFWTEKEPPMDVMRQALESARREL
ncbi:MAG: shikimate dehydrogenase [Candidatus Omnitrophica bacterium]|nr:shikimate dehydrogenase [Candidatus Omnitrophota bacterium]MBU1523371.1 shikimate dehydrogenase [Candidatus Omnitrophota bacterium]